MSLGAFWNDGEDPEYVVSPACGADFFQGPIVPAPGDTAYVSGRAIPDYKNLGMYSFAKYINAGTADVKGPETAQEAYNYMIGLNGLGNEIINPITGLVTRYANISDPGTGEGWIDGITDAPADRRMLMNAGPFTMDVWVDENGDGLAQVGEPGVQEVVAVYMIVQGTDALNSATRLKDVDKLAQLAYDLNFALPETPPNPEVKVHNLDQEVILTWSGDVESSYRAINRVDVDEEGNPTYYEFQGYNIYQTDSPVVGPQSTLIKLATFDIADGLGDIQDDVFSEEFGENVNATIQRAPDTGVERMHRITADALRGNRPLSNWNKYWFVVTSYAYNPVGIPKLLESPYTTIEIMPQQPADGLKSKAAFGQFIAEFSPDTVYNAAHTSTGTMSDGQLEVVIVDPIQITGRDYQVTFEYDSTLEQTVFNIDRMDPSGPVTVLEKQTNQSGDNGYNVVDGLMIKSIGPPPTFKRFLCVANAAGPVDPPVMAAYAFNASGFPTLDDLEPGATDNNDRPDGARQQTNGSTWGFNVGGGNGNFDDGSGSSFIDRAGRGSNLTRVVPYDFEMRFTAEGGFAIWAFTTEFFGPVPFELWNIGIGTPDDPSDDYRMVPWVLDEEVEDDVYNMAAIDHAISGGDNDPYMDWVYWLNPVDTSPGTAGYDAFVSDGQAGTYDFASPEVIARTILVNWNGGSVSDPTFPANVDAVMPEVGTVFRIISTKPNAASDLYTFSTAGFDPESGEALAKTAAQEVNVYPNPYFGQNVAEINPLTKFVTFTHLPENNATIRIFTISGSLIATIDDEDRTAQGTLGTNTAQWDLRNDYQVPVASGVYIIHVDMGNLGEKVLKAAVFMPEERLDKF